MSSEIGFNTEKATYSIGDIEISSQDARALYSFMQREYEREDIESTLDDFLKSISGSHPDWEYDELKKIAKEKEDDILYEYHENQENDENWYYLLQNAVEFVMDEAINKADKEKTKEPNKVKQQSDIER